MLFDTVDGYELELLYRFINQQDSVSNSILKDWHVPYSHLKSGVQESMNTLDTGLKYLRDIGFIDTQGNMHRAVPLRFSFRLSLLEFFRATHIGKIKGHELDSLFYEITDQIFVQRNQSYVSNLYQEVANANLGIGLTQTRVNVWKKIMPLVALGCQEEKGDGYYYYIAEELMQEIIDTWGKTEGDLQDFLEDHLSHFLPYLTENGYLSIFVELPLTELQRKKRIELFIKQDSASKEYTTQRWKGIRILREGTSL